LTKDSRKYPRFDVKWPVIVKNDTRIFGGELHVMSANGGFIRCGEPLEPNTIIHLTINVPESTTLELKVRVYTLTQMTNNTRTPSLCNSRKGDHPKQSAVQVVNISSRLKAHGSK
jgi:hypothetical protein